MPTLYLARTAIVSGSLLFNAGPKARYERVLQDLKPVPGTNHLHAEAQELRRVSLSPAAFKIEVAQHAHSVRH